MAEGVLVMLRALLLATAVLGAAACDGASDGDADADSEADGDTDADGDADAGDDAGDDAGGDADSDLPPGDVTVRPARIDDVLASPGMGFADFHFGWWCDLPPVSFTPEECAARVEANWPEGYPDAGTAYFRWTWRDLEPRRGEIDFATIDAALQSANALGENLAFRVMTIDEGGRGVPDWLLDAPYSVPGQVFDGTFWPDYRDATFAAEHGRLVEALGARYDGHPAVDHVDIGAVGCWGEWNTACIEGVSGIFEVFSPESEADSLAILAAYEGLIDDYVDSFPSTPVVMLGLEEGWPLEAMLHATSRGAGWRVDCWGDWGFWGDWSHMEDLYPAMIANATAADPSFPDLWQRAPVQLEVCGTIPDWLGFGWSPDPPDGEVWRTFEWALDQHASVLNGKSTEVPAAYGPALEDLLRRIGYRLAVDSFNHEGRVAPGEPVAFASEWSNLGVAPPYNPRALTYRLRGGGRELLLPSPADIRTWLPGSFRVVDRFTLPGDLPAGEYALELALLDRPGTAPETAPLPPLPLAIAGRGADGWYALSSVTVEP